MPSFTSLRNIITEIFNKKNIFFTCSKNTETFIIEWTSYLFMVLDFPMVDMVQMSAKISQPNLNSR